MILLKSNDLTGALFYENFKSNIMRSKYDTAIDVIMRLRSRRLIYKLYKNDREGYQEDSR